MIFELKPKNSDSFSKQFCGRQTHRTKGRGKLVKEKKKNPACQRNHAQVLGSIQKKKIKKKEGEGYGLFVCFVLSNSEKWAGPAGRATGYTEGLYVTEGEKGFFFFF